MPSADRDNRMRGIGRGEVGGEPACWGARKREGDTGLAPVLSVDHALASCVQSTCAYTNRLGTTFQPEPKSTDAVRHDAVTLKQRSSPSLGLGGLRKPGDIQSSGAREALTDELFEL